MFDLKCIMVFTFLLLFILKQVFIKKEKLLIYTFNFISIQGICMTKLQSLAGII
jgi:hypothetical protein